MIRARMRDGSVPPDGGGPPPEFDPRTLTGLFVAPRWLRELGRSAWLAVGIALVVVAAVWILALTQTIVAPVITATVVAAVAAPLLRVLESRGVGRAIGAALVLVAAIVLAVVVVVVVLGGIRSQFDGLGAALDTAKDTVTRWLTDVGVDGSTAAKARDDASASIAGAVPALLHGVGAGVKTLSSLAFFLALTALSLFFLLKDGALIRHWAEGHMRVPRPVAHQIGQRVLEALRGYFLGVTIVAAFNAVVVALGALVLGVPLAGTLAAITFLGAYVPYLGAWTAGAFAVLIALGGAGAEAAAGMIVVQLLANGLLQQLVQPVAYGAALGLHPLAVLIVTIAGGSLFGAVGLILAAPLTAAAARIAEDLSSRAPATAAAGSGTPADPAPHAARQPVMSDG